MSFEASTKRWLCGTGSCHLANEPTLQTWGYEAPWLTAVEFVPSPNRPQDRRRLPIPPAHQHGHGLPSNANIGAGAAASGEQRTAELVKQRLKQLKQQMVTEADALRLRRLDVVPEDCSALLLEHHKESIPTCQAFCPQSDTARYMCMPGWGQDIHCIGCQLDASVVVDNAVKSAENINMEVAAASWETRHLGMFTKSFPDPPPAPPPASCFKTGVCHCGRDKLWRRRFQMQAATAVKQLFLAGTNARERLLSGRSILWWAAAAGDHDQYVHVSLQYLKPWRPTLTLLERVGQDVFRIRAQGGAICLQSFLEFTMELSMDPAWIVHELVVADSRRPCAQFLLLSASILDDTAAQGFWAGLDEEIQKRRHHVDGLVEVRTTTSQTKNSLLLSVPLGEVGGGVAGSAVAELRPITNPVFFLPRDQLLLVLSFPILWVHHLAESSLHPCRTLLFPESELRAEQT